MGEKILVTGGAGYIGSHVVKQLGENNYDLIVIDNLSSGISEAVVCGKLIVGDLSNTELLNKIFSEHKFDAILHFAASISVPESVHNPLEYYANNTRNTLNLLQCCKTFQVNKLIFSSTAAVYGETDEFPVTELSPTQPLNPYGCSKLMSEKIIRDYSEASDLKYVILRYFNVAGADCSGKIGQNNKKAAHLIKIACDAALGLRDKVSIFGTDYHTPDGTGIRDYIHVQDLAAAHVEALSYLNTATESQILNCGYGKGYSVREVLSTVKKISGTNFSIIETNRRKGDPGCVIASAEKIKKVLNWKPKYNSLEQIISSTLDWQKKQINFK